MDKIKEYESWCLSPFITDAERSELMAMSKEAAEAFFGGGLGFGTSGVRGIRGLGSRGINRFTLGRYITAYARILASKGARRVLICRDSRIGGRELMEAAAACLMNEGIKTFVLTDDGCAPSPLLSYYVRKGGFDGGINLTSSHNTSEYSGVKIFGSDGVLISDEEARHIEEEAHLLPLPFDMPGSYELCHLSDSPIDDYASYVRGKYHSNGSLRTVFTPLHGVSGELMVKCAEACGFDISIVGEQMAPDGEFPTVLSPNPEDPAALGMAIEQAEREGADMVVALDPDGDRMGAAVRTEKGFVHINPNRMAALMLDYLLENNDKGGKCALVSTYVSGELPRRLAEKRGAEVFLTPTGFKNIADRRSELEKSGIRVLLSYEEAFGYMVEGDTWDKDGITAALTAMSAFERLMSAGSGLIERERELMAECGYYDERTFSFMTGKHSSMEVYTKTVRNLLEMPEDDKKSLKIIKTEHFDSINTLRIELECGILWVRPSGTEPKLKLYGHGRGGSLEEASCNAEAVIACGTNAIKQFMGE